MNYKHVFHAGNFADVFKHCVLVSLIQALLNKDKPMTYLETHAGSGCYALHSIQAQKTKEYRQGIEKLYEVQDAPAIVQDYLQIVRALNQNGSLKLYPGSPYIADSLLRPDDKMILCELHPEEAARLKSLFHQKSQVFVHHREGYEALKGLLPPTPRRGLILIDPPFEKEDEIEQLKKGLESIFEKWPSATIAVWYPIKNTQEHLTLLRMLRTFNLPFENPTLSLFKDPKSTKLTGTGMAIFNPPWQWSETLPRWLPWLKKSLI